MFQNGQIFVFVRYIMIFNNTTFLELLQCLFTKFKTTQQHFSKNDSKPSQLHFCLSCLLLKEILNTKLVISRMLSFITRIFKNTGVCKCSYVYSKKLKNRFSQLTTFPVVAVMVISYHSFIIITQDYAENFKSIFKINPLAIANEFISKIASQLVSWVWPCKIIVRLATTIT